MCVALGSEFGSEYASSKYVFVSERRLTFCANEGWVVLSLTSVDVDAPCDFHGGPFSSVWGIIVGVDTVVCS